jgi:hypothetical protein
VSSPAVALPGPLRRAVGWSVVARDRLLAVRPLYVVSTLVAVQWLAVLALALTVRHNGWVYYMGGDQLWHYSGAYLIVHGKLAPTSVGVGWSTLLAPLALILGPNLVSALPAIIVFNALVLLPLGVICMYGIGERIAGRLFGYWTALLWIAIPFIGIRYALHGYHQKWTEITLPQLLGLGAMSDYPSMIALVVGAYLCLRALDERHWAWAAGAGFAVGYALAVKPSNAVFLLAPGLLFVLFRARALVPFVLGLLPCFAALTFWKVRGEGNLPWRTTAPGHAVALGPGNITHRYLRDNSWTQLHNNLLQLREQLWSDRILEFLVIAGIAALLVRSRRAGIFVGVWFTVFLLLKGTYFNASVEDATFWRLAMPAFPAFVLLCAAVPLLVPGLRARATEPRPWRIPRRLVVVVFAALVALLSLFPIALVAATKPIRGPRPSAFEINSILVPESSSIQLQAQPNGGVVHLNWTEARSSAGSMFSSVFRYKGDFDVLCGPVRHAPDLCELFSEKLTSTHATEFVDRPGPGTWTYRIGMAANWLSDTNLGDVYFVGRPVTVKISS